MTTLSSARITVERLTSSDFDLILRVPAHSEYAETVHPADSATSRFALRRTFFSDFSEIDVRPESFDLGPFRPHTHRRFFEQSGIDYYNNRETRVFGSSQEALHVDPLFRGVGLTPLGLNPFSKTRNGTLVITADRLPAGITSAMIGPHEQDPNRWFSYYTGMLHSFPALEQRLGYFEARIKAPKGGGIWPAFWAAGNAASGQWPRTGELDWEMVQGRLYNAIHREGFSSGRFLPGRVDFDTRFFRYGILWTEEFVAYLLDRECVHIVSTGNALPDPMHLICNLQLGGAFGGSIDEALLPARMEVSEIAAYSIEASIARRPVSFDPEWASLDEPFQPFNSTAWEREGDRLRVTAGPDGRQGFGFIPVYSLVPGETYYLSCTVHEGSGRGRISIVDEAGGAVLTLGDLGESFVDRPFVVPENSPNYVRAQLSAGSNVPGHFAEFSDLSVRSRQRT